MLKTDTARVWWEMGEKRERRVHSNMAGYMSLIPTDSTPCLGVVAYISDHTETSSVGIWERQDVMGGLGNEVE
jgi:hypothetical protein